jgi:hypothetical protein
MHCFIEKPEITRSGWEDNIRMALKEIEWDGVEWIHLAQVKDQWQALVNTEPLGFTKSREFFDFVSDYELVKKDSGSHRVSIKSNIF